jgi:CubicO group peptidase (beta-lactamase class C family)
MDTKFRVGSMDKMFTSIAILQLVDAGKLQLTDTVGTLLPGYKNQDVADHVTVRQLLTHTGGTGDIFGPEFDQHRASLKELADYVRLYENRAPLFTPGERFDYSNYGFVLLGAIIEHVTGMSYYDYVQKAIFTPAGMNDTGFLPENVQVAGRSQGYMKVEGTWVPNTATLPYRGTSAGGGYSTGNDLLRFGQSLQGGTLLSAAMLEQATSDQVKGYGYGFFVIGQGSQRRYGHGGGAEGMNGELRVSHQSNGYIIVALSNFDPPSATRLYNYFALRMPTE